MWWTAWYRNRERATGPVVWTCGGLLPLSLGRRAVLVRLCGAVEVLPRGVQGPRPWGGALLWRGVRPWKCPRPQGRDLPVCITTHQSGETHCQPPSWYVQNRPWSSTVIQRPPWYHRMERVRRASWPVGPTPGTRDGDTRAVEQGLCRTGLVGPGSPERGSDGAPPLGGCTGVPHEARIPTTVDQVPDVGRRKG